MKIAGRKFKLVEITDAVIIQMEQILGVPRDKFHEYPTAVLVAHVSISTGLSPLQAKSLIEKHVAKYGGDSISALIGGAIRAVERYVRRLRCER